MMIRNTTKELPRRMKKFGKELQNDTRNRFYFQKSKEERQTQNHNVFIQTDR